MTQLTESSQLQPWLTKLAAGYLEIPAERVQTDVPLADYGLDSVYALTLLSSIEEELGLSLDDTVIWDHPTIEALAVFLAAEQARK